MPTDIELFAKSIAAIQCPEEADIVTWYPFISMSVFWQKQDAQQTLTPKDNSEPPVPYIQAD